MKNLLLRIRLAIIGISIIFLLVNCGGETRKEISSNEYLGKLPGLAKDYLEQIYGLKKDLEECTDRDEDFKLRKEIELLEKEANIAIDECLASNPITNLPFEQEADYKFKIIKVWVENSSITRIFFKAKVTITEDIKNQWGGFERSFFAYIKAVDKEGNLLTFGYGVMMTYMSNRGPFEANMEVEINGSLDDPAELVNFEKLVFVSREEYDSFNPNY